MGKSRSDDEMGCEVLHAACQATMQGGENGSSEICYYAARMVVARTRRGEKRMLSKISDIDDRRRG